MVSFERPNYFLTAFTLKVVLGYRLGRVAWLGTRETASIITSRVCRVFEGNESVAPVLAGLSGVVLPCVFEFHGQGMSQKKISDYSPL